MSLATDLRNLLSALTPKSHTRVIVRNTQQAPAIAHTLDVDRLHSILRMAEAGDPHDLFALYRDILAGHAHTQAEFAKRKLAVLGEEISLTAHNSKDTEAVGVATSVQNHLTDRMEWTRFLSGLLDSTLYPVSLAVRTYKPSARAGWRYELADLTPVPHHFLTWPDGCLAIRATTPDGTFTAETFAPTSRLHLQHQGHLLTSVPDWWGGPMRAILFWWLFATMDRDWWARFLDRFGAPFLVGKYAEEDERARYELQDAFSAATRLFGMAVTRETEVQMHQANAQGGGDAFEKFHTTANREISKLIIGQTSSSEIQTSGLGDSQGKGQSEVREDIRRYDARMLAHTIRTQILAPLWRLNGWTHPLPTVRFGSISEEEAELTGDLVSSLYTAGIELSDDGLQKLSGKLGLGLRRVAAAPAVGERFALSAAAPVLLPAVARRAARSRQARGAVDDLVRSATPKLARLMRERSLQVAAAIESADSPEAAAAAVATLAASYDPATAAELVSAVLSSAAVNAVLALD